MEKQTIILTLGLFSQILLIATLGQIGADLYLPSLPSIVHDFSVLPSKVQFTFASYLFGFSLSHLFYGPISDRIGRRTPILFGVGLSLIGCLVCAAAPSIEILILGRFLQGTGVGACNSVGRSLSRDFLSGAELAKVGSYLSMVAAFILASSPTLGGYLQYYFSWRAAFIFLSCYTLAAWIWLFKALPETHHHSHRNAKATQLNVVVGNYWILLTHKTFMGYTLCSSLAYAGIFAYLTVAPFLFQTQLGLTPIEFGWFSFFTAGGVAISGFINGRYVVRYGVSRMMLIGVTSMMIGALLLMLFSQIMTPHVITLIFPMIIFAFGVGVTFQNAFAGAFNPFPHMAGSAGALYGFCQVLGGSCSSALVASLHINNAFSLSCLLLIIGLCVIGARQLALSPNSVIDKF